jgi:hypothetical protein
VRELLAPDPGSSGLCTNIPSCTRIGVVAGSPDKPVCMTYADTGEDCPNPVVGKAKKLVPNGKGEYLTLCKGHAQDLRVQGIVGPLLPLDS